MRKNSVHCYFMGCMYFVLLLTLTHTHTHTLSLSLSLSVVSVYLVMLHVTCLPNACSNDAVPLFLLVYSFFIVMLHAARLLNSCSGDAVPVLVSVYLVMLHTYLMLVIVKKITNNDLAVCSVIVILVQLAIISSQL